MQPRTGRWVTWFTRIIEDTSEKEEYRLGLMVVSLAQSNYEDNNFLKAVLYGFRDGLGPLREGTNIMVLDSWRAYSILK